MAPLVIKGTDVSLSIHLDKSDGIFEFSGKSRPENAIEFFDPIFDWVDEYILNPNPVTEINFKLEYYNSSSAKVLLRLIVRFEQLIEKGLEARIKWHYRKSDEDIQEAGEDFATLVNIPFEYVDYQ
jgi:hypothetical protein